MKFYIYIPKIVFSCILIFLQTAAGEDGVGSGGGGDQYTIDFMKTLIDETHPWLVKNLWQMKKQIDAKEFLKNIEEIASRVESLPEVYESCDGSKKGREVAICYNYVTDKFYINRSMYPLDVRQSTSKILLTMHEIFRRMRLEGDKYELTRQLSVGSTNPALMAGCIINLYKKANFKKPAEKVLAVETCEKVGGDKGVQDCIVALAQRANFVTVEEKSLATKICIDSAGLGHRVLN